MPFCSVSRPQNDLLAALPPKEWAQVRPYIHSLFVPCGRTLYHPAANIDYVYFPSTAIISLSYALIDGTADAVALIGRDGFVGIEAVLRCDSAPYHARVQRAGHIYCIKCGHLLEACGRNGVMSELLLRYTQLTMKQLAQLVACNRHHPIDRQLCRWLLHYVDLVGSNDFSMTQEHIGNMLGVRRESVTAAARKLQFAGLISYQRGHVSILDRAGLEARSCECYARRAEQRPPRVTLAPEYRSGNQSCRAIHAAQSTKFIPNGCDTRPQRPRRTTPSGEQPCYIPSQSY